MNECYKPLLFTVRASLYGAACILLTPFFTAAYIVERLVLYKIHVLKMKILLGLKSAV